MWHYKRDGKVYGPLSAGELKQAAMCGQLFPDDLVWKEGLKKWVRARKVRGLFDQASPLIAASSGADCYQASGVGDKWPPVPAANPTVSSVSEPPIIFVPQVSANNSGSGYQTSQLGEPAALASVPSILVLIAFVLVPWLFFGSGSSPAGGLPIVLSIVSAVAGGLLFWQFVQPKFEQGGDLFAQSIAAFFFTAIVGIAALLIFQQVAAFATSINGFGVGPNRMRILFGVLKAIGYCYQEAFAGSSESPIAWRFVTMLLSVAICEELVKFAPVLFFAKTCTRRMSARRLLFVAASSGLGFGIAEGLFYSFTMYQPMEAPLGLYFVRFASCVALHAIWTTASAYILYLSSQGLNDWTMFSCGDGLIGSLFAISLVCAVSAVAHAVYNTVPPLGLLLTVVGTVYLGRQSVPLEINLEHAVGSFLRPLVVLAGIFIGGSFLVIAICAGVAALVPTPNVRSEQLIGVWKLKEINGNKAMPNYNHYFACRPDGTLDALSYTPEYVSFATCNWTLDERTLSITAQTATEPYPVLLWGSHGTMRWRITSLNNDNLILFNAEVGEAEVWVRSTLPDIPESTGYTRGDTDKPEAEVLPGAPWNLYDLR